MGGAGPAFGSGQGRLRRRPRGPEARESGRRGKARTPRPGNRKVPTWQGHEWAAENSGAPWIFTPDSSGAHCPGQEVRGMYRSGRGL